MSLNDESYSHIAVKNDKSYRKSAYLPHDLSDNLTCVFPRLRAYLTDEEKDQIVAFCLFKDARNYFNDELKEKLIARCCNDTV